jgi:flagellar motor protein MotB
MSSENKKPAEEEGGGESAPLWIISFADMISLLMAFFVMLSTFNNFDKQAKEKLFATARAVLGQRGGWMPDRPKDSLSPALGEGDDVSKGPEKRSQEKTHKTGQINQTYSKRFFTDKVFLVPMEFLFYSTGTGLTADGRKWLDNLSIYLSNMPGRILIAEQNNPTAASGPGRAVAAAEYLTRKNIESGRISISTRTTDANLRTQQDQMLEISVLEKDICP